MNRWLQKLGAWFLTDSGKSFVFGSAVAGAIGLTSCKVLPHTLLLNKYKEIVHLYKNGFTVPLPKPIKERFEKTLDLLELPEQDRMLFRPFMVYGFDIFSAGTTYTQQGVIIGIPLNFTYLDGNTMEKQAIQINHESIPWEMDEGKLLEKSLKVSEKAQMYAMAREVKMRQTPKFFIESFAAVFLFVSAYGIGNTLNTRYNFYAKSRSTRMVFYGLLGSFSLCNYLFIKDFFQLYYEQKVDDYLKSKDPIFKEGGKEFYHNVLERNVALRKLMGKVGESKYTLSGNENYWIRQRHLPLVQRKSFFEVQTA